MKKKQRDKIRKDSLKKNKGSKVRKPKKSLRTKRSKSTVGDIHFIHPSHIVAKKDYAKYVSNKGNDNKRPVAIVKEKKNNEVNISQIYGSKGKSKNFPRVKLVNTKMTKTSYIDIKELSTSNNTGKKYEKNKPPLNKKKGKVSKRDLDRRNKKKTTTK